MLTEVRPWHWRSIPLQNLTGAAVFAALFRHEPICTLLESPTPVTALARYSICAGAPRISNGHPRLWTPTNGEIFSFLTTLLHSNPQQTTAPPDLPFTGGWLGWLGYEAAWELEKLPPLLPDPLPFPVAYWYEPDNFAVIDHQAQILHLAVTDPQQIEILLARLQSPPSSNIPPITPQSALPPTILHRRGFANDHRSPVKPQITYLTTADRYQTAVRRVQEYIQAGDIYQANLSVRFSTQINSSGWEIYRRLQTINPSPFASYWQSPWGEVASCSPERLVSLQQGVACTRPIAGTRPRGADRAADLLLEQELLTNEKEIAEHIMLVDLERNDLGKICTWGSVEVDELLQVERYSHVMHLVSNVRGQLAADRSPIELLAATFPGGTITGCPKLRCMEIIAELESYPRNLFYGSCGYIDQRGHLDLNILIRTLLCQNGQLWGQVGAGIVADSDPGKEWAESLQKAQAQIQAICDFV
jgi:para-aminobenzoate synthetase component I